MTGPQYEALTGIRAIAPAWFRARGNGERPVLVNLWLQGTLVRRAHRRGKCARDNAYEYREAAELYSSGETRPPLVALRSGRSLRRARDATPVPDVSQAGAARQAHRTVRRGRL